MADIFDSDRVFFPEDPELRVLGSTEKLAQWRHRNRGPAFIRIGRRIAYHGTDGRAEKAPGQGPTPVAETATIAARQFKARGFLVTSPSLIRSPHAVR
ncbi:hypothetical protein AB0T83_18500 [Fluviibacterium sp. DFM31]|uniref:Uncharacterized protein n=1 Tax=Meridianimarinicoccus marinus TaxID=3231483 RepID=A0ABV3LB17_9RHOB